MIFKKEIRAIIDGQSVPEWYGEAYSHAELPLLPRATHCTRHKTAMSLTSDAWQMQSYWWIILYSFQVCLSFDCITKHITKELPVPLPESNQAIIECNTSRSERHNSSQNQKHATSLYKKIFTYQRAIKCFTFIVCSYPEYGIRVNCDIQRMNKIFVLVVQQTRTKRRRKKKLSEQK